MLDPGVPFVAGTPNIAVIGGIGVAKIDWTGATPFPGTTKPGATFAYGGTYADYWLHTRQCPFGGQIIIQGLPSPNSKYRVWAQKVGSPSPIALTDKITITDGGGNSSDYFPGPDGFFTYLDTSQNIYNNLAYWYSSGDDPWKVWLELADLSDNVLGTTSRYLIQLDNTPPLPPPNVPLTMDIKITSGTGDCTDTTVGDVVSGYFIADDLHFGAWSLSTEPNTVSTPSNQPIAVPPPPALPEPPLVNTDPAPATAGHAWTLRTDGPVGGPPGGPVAMKPCGYVVRLDVWDRSILNSVPYDHNANNIAVGFCLRAVV